MIEKTKNKKNNNKGCIQETELVQKTSDSQYHTIKHHSRGRAVNKLSSKELEQWSSAWNRSLISEEMKR